MLLFVISQVILYRLLLPSSQSYKAPNLWQLMSSLWKAICLRAVCFTTFKAIKMLNIINPYRILSLFSQQGYCTLEKWSERNYGYFFLFNLFLEANYLTTLYWFCHTTTWIHHGVHMFPIPNPSSPLSHTIPLDHPSAPASSILHPASDLDWRFVSYMILYMFQCHSPKSSHPLPIPLSPKDSSIHMCLFCCLCIQGYRYHLSKFHIYALVYYIGVFLSGLLPSDNRLQFHPPH